MRHVATLIRSTAPSYATCTALGVALFCVLPAAIGAASEAFFDAVTPDAGSTASAGSAVWVAVALLVALQVSEVVTEIGITHSWSAFSYNTHTLLQGNLLRGVLRGYGRHGLTVEPGDAIGRFRDEPPSITSGSMDGICDLVGRGAFGVVALIVMMRIDPVLAAAAFAPVIVGAAVSDALGTRASLYGAAARESTTRLTAFIGELMAGQLAVRVGRASSHAVGRVAYMSDTRRRMSVRDRVFAEMVNSMNVHLVHVSTGAVLLLGAGKIRSGAFTVGELALFVVYLDQLTYLPAEIGRVVTELKRTRVSIARMHALMPSAPVDDVVVPPPVRIRGQRPGPWRQTPAARVPLRELEVRGLTCVHPSTGRGVRDVSFALRRGSFTVVTGRIGAGKTTLLHAILGLLPLDAGELRWNGEVVADPATFFVPPQVAFTPQVPRLFSDSLRSNLELGVAAGEHDLQLAIRAAVLEDDVAAFDHGLDALVGPRGVKLSGGQVQRVAAARMFVRSPELLVFDDVSSALDAETEAELWRRLFERDREVTCLVVSHSDAALERADQVVHL
ncbi:MAG TPA: ABC transporter ATP-binding protein [Acidimicrobiales bacterium]|jgi:ATP-binding cassette, subfamily B, bacterial|nr:ABC transporter ATP-binding protein [Acidimicrobiales bacterium]